MAFDQIAESLDSKDNRILAINRLFHSLPDLPFLEDFYLQYKNYFHLSEPSYFFSNLHCSDIEIKESLVVNHFHKTKNSSKLACARTKGISSKFYFWQLHHG